ncbi:hypothetical protein [Azospirillum agricola]|uniref:hypothetical protein n=1 Tax=Azospirillum agricola TaxID=1720247 RepID=UPI000A0EF591|nr:hypothetical protein [Azospirillum agricola]MBP2231584.1 hypothetical protein [Azospirillum agricola]SMH43735.1 hypothetical protein SAMN02982994_1967 [Azospirillum lipoferum]
MQFNPTIPALPTLKPPSAITPTVQMALSPAVQAAQQTTPTVRTQTVSAPQATGKAEQTRDTRSSTQGGQSLDTNAGALAAQVNGRGYGGAMPRGSLLDVSV